jgi:KDO2-lipid IV(A) lauroyltransferase
VVLLTGHVGNWEIGGAALAARGLPIDGVAKPMANRLFEQDLFASRERLGLRIIETGAAPREVLRSLRRGRVVGMLGDQNTHRDPVFIPFFGTPAATSRGPALFALRSGAPVFLGVALREPGWGQRYKVSLEPLHFAPSGRLDDDVRDLTTAYSQALERAVRLVPDQYFWQHRRWKTRPSASVEGDEEPWSDRPRTPPPSGPRRSGTQEQPGKS